MKFSRYIVVNWYKINTSKVIKRKETEMTFEEKYNGKTREEAIQWRMDVYGEFKGVAEAKVDDDINGTKGTPSDDIDWLFTMLDNTYC